MKKKHVLHLTLGSSLLILLLAIILSNFSLKENFSTVLQAKTAYSQNEILTQQDLSALGLQQLAGDEVGIIHNSTGKPSGKKINHSIALKSGKVFSFESDQNSTVNVIEGDSKSTKYIKAGENLQIFKKDALDNKSGDRIDKGLSKKLSSKDVVVPVIVRIKVPYGKLYEPKQILSKFKDKLSQFEGVKNKILSHFSPKSKHKKDLQIIGGFAADIDSATLSELEKDPNVEKVEIDQQVRANLDASVAQIGANNTWNQVDGTGQPLTGKGERIAIIDTGVDYTHPDLGGCLGAGCKVVGGYDFANNDPNPMDDQGHGTHVAATAAGKGVLNGVAPDANIVAIKVLDVNGSGLSSTIISGINYATDPNGDGNPIDHVDVASMSLGGTGNPDDAMSVAVDNATAAGVTFTVAAGNSGPGASTILSPGTARTAITVAASCKTAQIGVDSRCASPIASFSSRGPLVYNGVDIQKPDVVAPGVMICAARFGTSFSSSPTCIDSAHVRISGTSMATPHVAGLAALIRQANPSFTPDQVKQTLKSTGKNLGMTYNDQGNGEIDASKAIPASANATSSPGSWTISSDPTNKLSTHSQIFSVSASYPLSTTLSMSLDSAPVGVTFSSSKPSIQVGGGQSDSFNGTINIDNDLARPGTYSVRILLAENGVTKAIIPVSIIVKPTITVDTQSVDYGVDSPSLSSWTSATKTITLANLRTDASQNVAIGYSAFQSGISFQTPSSVSLPASGSAAIDTKFTVDNSQVGNKVYTGTLNLSGASTTLKVDLKFTKFYVLTVQDPSPDDLKKANQVYVHNRLGVSYADYVYGSPHVFFLNSPGTYDVIVEYLGVWDDATQTYQAFTVVKEGIAVSTGSTVVNVNKTDAKNWVKINPTDPSGAKPFIESKSESLEYLPQINTCCTGSYTFMVNGADGIDKITGQYFSNMSSNYRKESLYGSEIQPVADLHYYYGGFTGLSDNLTITNSASDFKTMQVKWDPDQQSGSFQPLIRGGVQGGLSAVYYSGATMPMPVTQTIYSNAPVSAYVSFRAAIFSPTYILYDVDNTPDFSVNSAPQRWIRFNTVSKLPDFKENVVYNGIGPAFFEGKFVNTNNSIKLESYYDPAGYACAYECFVFLRQDFTRRPTAALPYSIYKNGSLFYTGTIPSFPSSFGLQPVSAAAGKYEMRTDYPYKSKGLDMLGRVSAFFDTSLADSNPPSIKRMYVYSGSKRSEQYDPTVINKVEFELDPVGGSLSKVGVSYSKDGGNTFQSLTTTNTSGEYSANITPVSGIAKVMVKISATDNSSNSVDYSFELPVGPGTALVDSQAPSVMVKSPSDGATVTGTFNVTTDAADNFGVAKAELYIDDVLKATTATESYGFTFDGSTLAPGNHTLYVKAYDESANIGTSQTVTVNKQVPVTPTPTPVIDTIAPTVTITSPLNGAKVARRSTVTISANATDNVGVTKVEFYVNNVLTCTKNTSPYSCSWLVPNKTATYTITAKAYDPAGNIGTKSITVTSK